MTGSLLTARQVQELLDVDTSTVYRMAGDGRLPAVRIGRQWRFPADEVDALLTTGVVHAPPEEGTQPPPASRRLPSSLATMTLEMVAPALGVSMVVTDLGGRPLTPIVNPAPAISARIDDPGFTAACSSDWAAFADEPHLTPRWQSGRFGFLCAHSLVRHGNALIAMVLAGGVATEDDNDPDLYHLGEDRRTMVLETLPRTAALLSRLATPDPSNAN